MLCTLEGSLQAAVFLFLCGCCPCLSFFKGKGKRDKKEKWNKVDWNEFTQLKNIIVRLKIGLLWQSNCVHIAGFLKIQLLSF